MKKLTLVFCALIFVSGAALADLSYQSPASLLIYPFFSTSAGEETIISVTNVNRNNQYNPQTGKLWGDVFAHFFYVDEETCDVTNRREFLTPADIFTTLASQHNPAMNRGYLMIIAEDANTRAPVVWDGIQVVNQIGYFSGLIGDAVVANGILNFQWAIPAIGIRAYRDTAGGGPGVGTPIQNLAYGVFGGYEYLPSVLYSSSFLEQGFVNTESTLVLVSPILETSTFDLYFLFYDNEEDELSQTTEMDCFFMEKLLDIFGGADDVNTANATIPTGYFATQAESPQPILGMLIQALSSDSFSSARLLHHAGATRGGVIDL